MIFQESFIAIFKIGFEEIQRNWIVEVLGFYVFKQRVFKLIKITWRKLQYVLHLSFLSFLDNFKGEIHWINTDDIPIWIHP